MITRVGQYIPSPFDKIAASVFARSQRAIGRNYTECSYQGNTIRFLYWDGDSWLKHRQLIDKERSELTTEGLSLSHLTIEREVDVVVDVGAHFGIYSVLMGILNPSAQILAYEPSARPRKVLVQNLELNGLEERAIVHDKPVTAESGDFVAFTNDPNPYSDRNQVVDQLDEFNNTVRTVSLSDALRSEGFTHPFLKIDAEGQEENILPDLIEQGGADALSGIVEFHPDKMTESVDEIEELMWEAGWSFEFILESSPEYKHPRPIYSFSQS